MSTGSPIEIFSLNHLNYLRFLHRNFNQHKPQQNTWFQGAWCWGWNVTPGYWESIYLGPRMNDPEGILVPVLGTREPQPVCYPLRFFQGEGKPVNIEPC